MTRGRGMLGCYVADAACRVAGRDTASLGKAKWLVDGMRTARMK